MAFRYNLTMSDDLPAGRVTAYTRGAIVNGEQSAINTVNVFDPHDIQIGDKFLYALTRSNIQTLRVFTVTGRAATTVTFSGAVASFPDGCLLVPLGTDTGGELQDDGTYSLLNWDGSTVSLFNDQGEDSPITAATVTVEPGGELGFFSDTEDIWAVSRTSGGKPLRVYILGVATSASAGGSVIDTDTIWDAKGDIVVGSANDAADNLAVGTNGQVLTADSGETLGVKWNTPLTVSTDTLWNAKGDIAVATAADTATRLAVGANTFVLTADSAEATGVKWAASSSGVAEDDSEIHIAVSVFH